MIDFKLAFMITGLVLLLMTFLAFLNLKEVDLEKIQRRN